MTFLSMSRETTPRNTSSDPNAADLAKPEPRRLNRFASPGRS
jgi:hypothetical protein